MRAVLPAILLSLAACSQKSVDEHAVVDYLQEQPPAARARIVAEANASEEHPGLIHRGDKDLTLVGVPLPVGSDLPDLALAEIVNDKLDTLQLGSLRGQLVVLSVVPSIDTRVCEIQTHTVSDAIAKMPPDTVVITVSRDLPFAQTRFAEEALTKTRMASDYKDGTFGQTFGVEVKETGLLARSVWVFDRDGKLAYREIVDDQGDQPDYEAMLIAVSNLDAS